MMFSNVIVASPFFIARLIFFSQSCVKVSASLADVGSLVGRAFDIVNCSLSVVGFIPVFNVGQQVT